MIVFFDPEQLAEILFLVTVGAIGGALAFALLVMLFNRVMDTCHSRWANNPPMNQVVIEAGNLRLEFGCTVEPVPWEFIVEFAESRRDALNRGFAPVFAKE